MIWCELLWSEGVWSGLNWLTQAPVVGRGDPVHHHHHHAGTQVMVFVSEAGVKLGNNHFTNIVRMNHKPLDAELGGQ